MHIVKLAVLIMWFSQKGNCLNLTHHGNDVETLKESLQQLTTSVQQMQADYSRKEALFRSEIDELKNETSLLKAQLSKSKAYTCHTISFTLQESMIELPLSEEISPIFCIISYIVHAHSTIQETFKYLISEICYISGFNQK